MPKAKAKAKTQAKRRKPKVAQKTLRQFQRRAAITVLNTLATEVQLASAPLRTKAAQPAEVERYILKLETRCLTGDLPGRLRAAVEQWSKRESIRATLLKTHIGDVRFGRSSITYTTVCSHPVACWTNGLTTSKMQSERS